jgi:hypothetical protein
MTDQDEQRRVVRRKECETWPEGKEFPLTPLEAWYVMQGWSVRPARPLSLDEFLELPGQLEFADGYVMLRQT